MDAGQLRLTVAAHGIEDLVNETLDTLTPLTVGKPLQLSAQFQRPLPSNVMLDVVRVR